MAKVSLLGIALNRTINENTETILLSCQSDFDEFIRPIIYDAVMSINFNKITAQLCPETKYLSSKDIELQFGIPENTLEHWRSQGMGPTYTQVGRRIFYKRSEFECFLKSCEVKTSGRVDE